MSPACPGHQPAADAKSCPLPTRTPSPASTAQRSPCIAAARPPLRRRLSIRVREGGLKLSWNGALVSMDCPAGLGAGYRRGKHLAVPRTWKRYGTLHHRLDITISHGLAPASRLAGMPVSIQRLGAASGVAPLQTIERPFGTGHHPRPFGNLYVEAVRHVRAVRLKDGIDGIHQLPHQ